MAGMGCPKCGRTPVVYLPSSQKWVCKHCRHEWARQESSPDDWDEKWGPEYVVSAEAVERIKAELHKAAKKQRSSKQSKTHAVGKAIRQKASAEKPSGKKPAAKKKAVSKTKAGAKKKAKK
jgi:hypothetical protein